MTTHSAAAEIRPAVTVLGLGEMGAAVAAAFLAGGHPTTVWNRTPTRAAALITRGARRAATAREAVAASRLVVVSVKGNEVAREILEPAADVLAGRAVVNLTDGTSASAAAVADWVTARGAQYLHGQIMTIAPGIGDPDAVVFYGGAEAVYRRHRPTLRLLGGRSSLVSDDPGRPALYGMAVHGTMWGALNGFLHAAALLSSEGVEVTRFLHHAGASVGSIFGLLPSIADEIDRGEHATPYGALRHHLPSVRDLLAESRARRLDEELPGYTYALTSKAIDNGHGDDSYSRLVEHFRATGRP
jgi:3-hydroxyisobutyrate dehydrogenase-like beta-hydroxyacid dehydrogenase